MRHTDRGVTLVEVCVVVAVSVLIVTAAAPSMRGIIVRQTLRGSADELRTDLQYLRASSVARDETLWMAVQHPSGSSCYVLHTGSKGDCACDSSGNASCTDGSSALKVVAFEDEGPVSLGANVDEMAFEPVHGTAAPAGSVTLKSQLGDEIRHIVGITGRVRSCSPGGRMAGYPPC